MEKIIFTAPEGAMPEVNSNAYLLLKVFSDKQSHPRDELCKLLGGGIRSDLQKLMNNDYRYWLIHTEMDYFKGRKQAFYRLDERHYSCDWEADKDARTIARKQYKDRSYNGCKNAVENFQQKKEEKEDADKAYKERIESKKPTKN